MKFYVMHCPNKIKKILLSYVTICGCRELKCICYVTFCIAIESSKRKFPQLLNFKGAISNFQVFFGEITVKLINFYDYQVATIWSLQFVLLEVFQPITVCHCRWYSQHSFTNLISIERPISCLLENLWNCVAMLWTVQSSINNFSPFCDDVRWFCCTEMNPICLKHLSPQFDWHNLHVFIKNPE